MFKRHSNPTQQDSNPCRKRSRIRAGVLAASALGAGLVGTLGAGAAYANGAATAPRTSPDVVAYVGTPLGWGQTLPAPDMSCPAAYPYVLNQRYNTNTSFRIDPGIDFGYWSWGFDASVFSDYSEVNTNPGDPKNPKWVATGLDTTGHGGVFYNSVSYWGNPFGPKTNWTLFLHCTSDINKAVHMGGW